MSRRIAGVELEGKDMQTEELEVLRQILRQLEDLSRRLDEFISVYLEGTLPHGKPADRWRRR